MAPNYQELEIQWLQLKTGFPCSDGNWTQPWIFTWYAPGIPLNYIVSPIFDFSHLQLVNWWTCCFTLMKTTLKSKIAIHVHCKNQMYFNQEKEEKKKNLLSSNTGILCYFALLKVLTKNTSLWCVSLISALERQAGFLSFRSALSTYILKFKNIWFSLFSSSIYLD